MGSLNNKDLEQDMQATNILIIWLPTTSKAESKTTRGRIKE